MIKLFILLLFLFSKLLFANIDTNKYAITIGLSNTLQQAKDITKSLDKYDTYIYKTTQTKKPYYVIYAVNIKKDKLNQALKDIKLHYKDAYQTAKTRVIKLKNNNFEKNIFISKKPIINLFQINNKKQKINKIDISKKSILAQYVKNKKQLYDFIKTHRQYDLFIQNIKNKSIIYYDRCCVIYIVNLTQDKYDSIKKDRSYYPNLQDVSSMKLYYISLQKELSTYIEHKI